MNFVKTVKKASGRDERRAIVSRFDVATLDSPEREQLYAQIGQLKVDINSL